MATAPTMAPSGLRTGAALTTSQTVRLAPAARSRRPRMVSPASARAAGQSSSVAPGEPTSISRSRSGACGSMPRSRSSASAGAFMRTGAPEGL
ncbi:MAG: hypothetical protein QM767_21740 [Anaeromyxobacter sp.]